VLCLDCDSPTLGGKHLCVQCVHAKKSPYCRGGCGATLVGHAAYCRGCYPHRSSRTGGIPFTGVPRSARERRQFELYQQQRRNEG
jgi:hypothetical protein